MLYHCNLICISPKHGMHGCSRCLKILYFHNCWNLFFVPEPLWNSDNHKIIKLQNRLFYRNVTSPFAVKLFLLPFTSHFSKKNISFNDSGYIIKPPQPSSTITELCLLQATLFSIVANNFWSMMLYVKIENDRFHRGDSRWSYSKRNNRKKEASTAQTKSFASNKKSDT